jgi:hypothetical protein
MASGKEAGAMHHGANPARQKGGLATTGCTIFPPLIVEFAFMSSGYIPAPPPPPLVLPKSWFSRNWKWFVPTLILGLVLLLALFVGGLLTFVFGLLKSSEPYQHAVAVASSNPDVVRELGTPIVPGWYLSGNINVSGSSGDANLAIPLNGSLHRGTVYVVAKKTDDAWSYDKLEMLVEGHEIPIELLPSPAKQPQSEDK